MAVVIPICCKIPCRDQTLQVQKVARHNEHQRGLFWSAEAEEGTRPVRSSAASNEKQLKSLSSYFDKLQDKKSLNKGLEVLDTYLEKLVDKEDEKKLPFAGEYFEQEEEGKSRTSYANHDEEISDLYLVGVLASINVAVVLFELASPVKSSELELSTIPLLYGAKVNHLIVVGEWWRLVTPMFLHSGAFDIGLSCWSLGTFGPKVCRGYGWFTFLLIYILGGVSGNLISFLHTPQSTVGGTGPGYAIIGAWLIYQLQNKDVIPKDVSETMFQKAIVATGLGLILSHFCPIDEWAHFGAVFTGVAYGYLWCPTLQADESTPRTGHDEGITIVNRQYDPFKSLFLFGFFVIVLTLLFFLVEPPLNDQVIESFL